MDLGLNQNLASKYHGATQIARVLTEDWVARNMYCPVCGNPILQHYTANKPVADFYCEDCKSDFELKSKCKPAGELSDIINDGQYDKMIERITSYSNPNFFFMHYADFRVRNLIFIPNHFFTPDIIIKRKPLASTARRAGWVGCKIDISKVPSSGKIFIIREREVVKKEKVHDQYLKTSFLKESKLQKRGWILDVLSCVERIPSQDFSLKEVYAFEKELSLKHPENNFIRDKIRQQLQYLRNQGFIRFTARGRYCKL